MGTWDRFWKNKGKKMEWNQKDILDSKGLKKLCVKILSHLNKPDLKGLNLIEIGAGMGITSLFFGYHGANVTLLDSSEETEPLAGESWEGYAQHKFICADLFEFKPRERYDIVTSFGLCEHFIGKRREEVLQKHVDILRDKGVAIISVPYKYGIFYRTTKKLAELTGFWEFGLEVPFSKIELIKFAESNKLDYEIIMSGFYSSLYDLLVRKPLKVLKISTKRRFDDTKSMFDNLFGSGIIIILKK